MHRVDDKSEVFLVIFVVPIEMEEGWAVRSGDARSRHALDMKRGLRKSVQDRVGT